MSTDSRPASSHAGSKPSGMWQPPSLEEMQAMLPQYQFISLLGRGGMGAVYKAVQVSLDRAVAIKVLPGDLIDDVDAQFAERFKNEARTMAKMNHPAIVNVYDFGETQTGLLFIVMEFIDGTDVSKMIASQGKLPADYALAITAHVCDALNYAHSHSIVHRDIKPANILINMEGAVKVADFGLAKQSDAGAGGLTKTNMAMGTPDFVAPEALIPGVPLDGRADLYAIGVMLYQMLTGEIPRGMWTMPSAKLGTDPRFDTIIGKAMQTDREARYQTAASIRRDLDVIMTTPPAAVKKPSAQGPQAPQQRKVEAVVRKEAAAKPADLAPAKKSNTGFYLGMAATVIALGVVVFLFSGAKKPAPEPQIAEKAKVVVNKPKPKPPSPAPAKSTVAAPAATTSKPGIPAAPPVVSPASFVNSLGMKFVALPGTDVLICIHETRRKDYAAYADAAPGVDGTWKAPLIEGKPLTQSDDHPVVAVSWEDATAFCAWLSKKEGHTYRLPSEHEWNLAVADKLDDPKTISPADLAKRIASQYPWGTGIAEKHGNYDGEGDGFMGTAPVMSFSPNHLGIYDLGGNVWEWCGDWFAPDQKEHVLRGCGYRNHGSYLRSGNRQAAGLDFRTAPHGDSARRVPGFRIVTLGSEPALLAVKAPPPMPVTPPPPAVPDTVDTAPWANAISLLPLVDVEKDMVKAGWTRESSDFVSNGKFQPALVELPVIPPEEYDLRVRFSKITGGDAISLVLSRGDRSFVWYGGVPGNTVFGFGNPQGVSGRMNQGITVKTAPSPLVTSRTYNVQISVRKTGATAYLDGAKISELPADLADMRPPETHQLRTAGVLGFATYKTSYAVHAVELREVTGKVKYLREQPAADLVAQRLAQLEQQFLAAYEKQAGAAHKAAVADLNVKFTAALDRSIATVSQAGRLDEALALRNEKTLIQTSGTVPEEDAADTSETLKTLRKTYRATMTTLLATRDKNTAPLHAAYDRALAAYQEELTKAQKLDDALRVKAVREHVSTQRDPGAGTASPQPGNTNPGARMAPLLVQGTSAITPTAPPLAADKVLPPQPKATPDEVRALVEWCLGVRQGTVEVLDSGQRRRVSSLTDLPKGKLTLLHFFIYDQPMNDDWKKWLAVLGRVPELESLFFYYNPGPFPIEALRGLTKLKSLRLSPATMDEAAFAHLSGLKSLEQLYLGCNQFTGTGLGYIGENLQDLTTDSKTISAEGLAYLPRFKKLKQLNLTNSAVTDDMLQGLAALSELEFLDVKSTNLDGSFLAHLPSNSKLKHLVLSSTKNFKPENLVLLARLKDLEELTLPPVNPGPAEMAAIASLSKLIRLNFSSPTFTGESFAGAKGFSSLTLLDLGEAAITDAGWQAISAFSSLEELVFSRPAKSKAPFSAAAFGTHLGQLRNLRMVAAINGGITDEWMPAIAQLKNLTRLSLQGAGITDAGLMHLSKLPLQEINIGQTAVTDAGLQTLKTFPKLYGTRLPATSAKLTDAAKEELVKFLAGRKGK